MPPREVQSIQLTDMLISHLTSPYFIRSEAELQKSCRDAGFQPESDRFVLMIVHFERWSDVFSSDDEWLENSRHNFFILHNMLHDLLGEENIALVGEKDYQMVCLINLLQPWDVFQQKTRPALRDLMEILETEFNISVTIALSEEAHSLLELPEAYRQAREVLWYNEFLELDAQVTAYGDLYGRALQMIHSDLTILDKKLITRIQMGDIAGVKYALHEMLDREFLQARPSVQILRVRLGGICCKILDALEEFHQELGDDFYYALNPGPKIVEARNITELSSNMDELFDSIIRKKNAASQEPKPQWVDRMSHYISEHFMDENLGLTEVSAAFGITPSYATRVFKQYTGRGIYETIQHVRLDAAKNLMSSDRTMKQIAMQVGYTSFLSMNRAFKKYEGTTPSRFRAK